MNPAGALLVVLGIWISSQVWGGNALQRLNIVKPEGTVSKIAPIEPHAGGGNGGGGGGSF